MNIFDLTGIKVSEYSFFEAGEGKSLCDQHFKQIDTRVDNSIKCKKSVSNPKELATALEGLSGLLFQVLKIDRSMQPKDHPASISDLHYVSYLNYIYKEETCTGIKFLEQSFGVTQYEGIFKSKEELNLLWKKKEDEITIVILQTTKSSAYDPFLRQDDIQVVSSSVVSSQDQSLSPMDIVSTTQTPSPPTITRSFKPFIKKKLKEQKKKRQRHSFLSSVNKKHHKKITRYLPYKSQAHHCNYCKKNFILQSYYSKHVKQCMLESKQIHVAINKFRKDLEIAKGTFNATNTLSNKIIDTTPVKTIDYGFACTPTIMRVRFTEEQKKIMIELYEKGKGKGQTKCTPQQAANQLNNMLEPGQIQAFWSRYKKKHDDTKSTTSSQPTQPTNSDSQPIPVTSSNSSADQLPNLPPTVPSGTTKNKRNPKCRICKKLMKGHPKNMCKK